MAQRQTIPFIGPQSVSKSVAVNNQATVNFVHSRQGMGAKAAIVLESAPGLVDLIAAGSGPCRTPQMVNFKGKLYGVFGRDLVSIDDNLVVTVVSSFQLDDVATTCSIARGRNFVMVVDGSKGYTWDDTTFLEITDLDFPANFTPTAALVTHVTYLDGFFIVNNALSDLWYISAIENPTNWNGLDFEAAAVSPDAVLAHTANGAILWMIGDETAQPYYNSGNFLFPYRLILNAVQEVGIAAPHSLAESDDGVFWLATTPEGGLFVYRIQGQAGQVISGEEQDTYLATQDNIKSATGFIYKQAGKSFYILQLDVDKPTLVYNINVGVWETRTLIDGSAWRIAGHGVLDNARNIGGSRLTARIYELDTNVYSDSGGTFIRRRRTQIYHRNGHLLDWWEIVVDVAPGVGLEGDVQGSDPTIRLRFSNDAGLTWGAWLIEPIGRQGEFERRAVFRNLGSARNRVFEIEAADPVEITIINAYAVIQELMD